MLTGVALVIAACTNFPAMTLKSSTTSNPALDYYHWVLSSPDKTVAEERKKLERNAEDIDPIVRMTRLAMVLSVPKLTIPQDEEQAMTLLDRVIQAKDADPQSAYSDYREFSILWRDMLETRQEMRHNVILMKQELTAEKDRINKLRQENRALLKQIEALKSIEQQINQREQSREKPK